ncbi:hypothetical protein ElP_00860 [Tautonia plasticadhaerens]|uniref:Uncharacterized protein n=1 Tax=Tautonia plasticadhaerens TaxID=2527974 RepID=A0A518GUK2_9BACT|nr:hypothetical protein ElP_00860 [Tautonia plasticadhaerens]
MATRILHCGRSSTNDDPSLDGCVFGFRNRSQQIGDPVYLVVKHEGATGCGISPGSRRGSGACWSGPGPLRGEVMRRGTT